MLFQPGIIAEHQGTIARAEAEIKGLQDQMTNKDISTIEAELLREQFRSLCDRNLRQAAFEEKVDLVAKLGLKIMPTEDLKSRKIYCRLNLAEVNKGREQYGFAKVTFGGAEGIRTPYLLNANQAFSQVNYGPKQQNYITT